MASNYAINLQAKLDTSSVQAELKKLREMQQQMGQGGNGQGNSAAQVNVGNIDRTLAKLNSTMLSLQKSLDRLSGRTIQLNSTSSKDGTKLSRGTASGPIAPFNWRGTPISKQNELAYNWFSKQRGFQDFDTWSRDYKVSRTDVRRYGSEYNAARTKYMEFVRTQWKDELDKLKTRRQFTASRQIAGLFAGQLIGGAADILNGVGETKGGTIAGAIGQGVSAGFGSAAAISMAGGGNPVSIAVGAIVGVATAATQAVSGLNQLAKQAREAAEAQRRLVDRFGQSAQQQDMGRLGFQQEYESNIGLQSKNFKEAQRKRQEFEKKYEESRAKFMELESSWDVTRRLTNEWREQEKNLRRVTERPFYERWIGRTTAWFRNTQSSEERLESTQRKYTYDVQDYQDKFSSAMREAKQFEGMFQTWKGVEDRLKSEREAWSKEVIRRREAVRIGQEGFERNRRGIDSVNSTEVFSLGVLRNRSLAPQEQFNQIGAELDALRKQRNERLQEAFDLNKRLKNAGTNLSPARLESMQRERDLAVNQAGVVEHRISVLENALTQIRDNSIPPDFSHMTSLGQYGFNMGEKERTETVMQTYYSKMTNLTQQIRDKLDEGITTQAVYGE